MWHCRNVEQDRWRFGGHSTPLHRGLSRGPEASCREEDLEGFRLLDQGRQIIPPSLQVGLISNAMRDPP